MLVADSYCVEPGGGYQTLPLISPQEAVASGDVPLIENAFTRYRQDLLSAIDTIMVVQEPYTQDA